MVRKTFLQILTFSVVLRQLFHFSGLEVAGGRCLLVVGAQNANRMYGCGSLRGLARFLENVRIAWRLVGLLPRITCADCDSEFLTPAHRISSSRTAYHLQVFFGDCGPVPHQNCGSPIVKDC